MIPFAICSLMVVLKISILNYSPVFRDLHHLVAACRWGYPLRASGFGMRQIASDGHLVTHRPHPIQWSKGRPARTPSLFMVIASILHRSRHISQPVQFSPFIRIDNLEKTSSAVWGIFSPLREKYNSRHSITHHARILVVAGWVTSPASCAFLNMPTVLQNLPAFPYCFLYKTAQWTENKTGFDGLSQPLPMIFFPFRQGIR